MRTATILGIVGASAMTIAIMYAFLAGDFVHEAKQMVGLPWFHLSMIDLYAGFFLVGGWIFFRERSRMVALIWLVLLLTLGNLTSFVYIVLAARRADGWREFWLGDRVVHASAD